MITVDGGVKFINNFFIARGENPLDVIEKPVGFQLAEKTCSETDKLDLIASVSILAFTYLNDGKAVPTPTKNNREEYIDFYLNSDPFYAFNSKTLKWLVKLDLAKTFTNEDLRKLQPLLTDKGDNNRFEKVLRHFDQHV